MENTMSGGQIPSPAYDFRLYDRVWQRVAPGMDPFSVQTDAAGMTETAQETAPAVPAAPAVSAAMPAADPSAVPTPAQEAELPGATPAPCCMGTAAQESLEVLEGFIQEELAESRCCQTLACRIRNQQAAQLLCKAAQEKRGAAKELCAARFLITGERYHPAITLEQNCWDSLAQALRAFYHQEACNGLNYQRAADETIDFCLQKLFSKLAEQSYRRAEEMMTLLGKIVCC